MKINISINLQTNRLVRHFIMADLALLAGWGLIEPILSIYVISEIEGATLITVGTAAGIYWIFKSILQIPIANFLDKKSGEEDDFHILVAGLFIAACAAFLFGFVKEVWHLYIVQLLHAVGFALYVASWPAIFSRHLDKDRVSFDWALDSTAVGIAAGISGFLGSVLASAIGFRAVFALAAIFTLLSAFVLLLAPDLVLPKKVSKESRLKDHTPANLGR
jgi:MFS family permease